MSASCITLRRETRKTPKLNLVKELKRCCRCKTYLRLIEFARDRSRRDGLCAYCRRCHSVRNKGRPNKRPSQSPKTNKRKPGRPREPYYPGAPKAFTTLRKRRKVEGTALESDILMFLTQTLLPQKAIAKRLRVSEKTVSRIKRKHFAQHRPYQHTIFETRRAPKRRGYGL